MSQEQFGELLDTTRQTVSKEELGWKKSTTYTVFKKLCEKGILKNKDGVVTTLISREKFFAKKSRQFVEESFNGSLPAFIAAFYSGKKLTKKDAEEIQQSTKRFFPEPWMYVNIGNERNFCALASHFAWAEHNAGNYVSENWNFRDKRRMES